MFKHVLRMKKYEVCPSNLTTFYFLFIVCDDPGCVDEVLSFCRLAAMNANAEKKETTTSGRQLIDSLIDDSSPSGNGIICNKLWSRKLFCNCQIYCECMCMIIMFTHIYIYTHYYYRSGLQSCCGTRGYNPHLHPPGGKISSRCCWRRYNPHIWVFVLLWAVWDDGRWKKNFFYIITHGIEK